MELTKLTFEQWWFLQTAIYKKICCKKQARKSYQDKDEYDEIGVTHKGYKTFEGLTTDGEDLYYIASICAGEASGDFYVVSLTDNYKTTGWYNWYSIEDLEKTFKKLNKSIFYYMGQELDRI